MSASSSSSASSGSPVSPLSSPLLSHCLSCFHLLFSSRSTRSRVSAFASPSDPAVNTESNSPLHGAYAPGRVNLIGEHVDYCDGFVFPIAIERGTYVIGRLNGLDGMYRIASANAEKQKQNDTTSGNGNGNSSDQKVDHAISLSSSSSSSSSSVSEDSRKRSLYEAFGVSTIEPIEITAEALGRKPTQSHWTNYVIGCLSLYSERIGRALPGFDCFIGGNVPLGGGLSSSASLEVAMLAFCQSIMGEPESQFTPAQRALLAQRVEHDYAGVPCGLMDQFISSCGQADSAMLLDCRSREFELIPLTDPDITVLITNSNVSHSLASGEYAQRRSQVSKALERVHAKFPSISSLRDCTYEQLIACADNFNVESEDEEELYFCRARHVIMEIGRCQQAAQELKRGNYNNFGRLMIQSHVSLKNDFEVSCEELDTLVDAALSCDGVYGSRMTGGGFGGSTVTLVKTSALPLVQAAIALAYKTAHGIECSFLVTKAAHGAMIFDQQFLAQVKAQ